VLQTQANLAISTGFVAILEHSASLDSSGQEQPFCYMLTQNEHNQFSLDISPIKKQCIGTSRSMLSPYPKANDCNASNALLSLSVNTTSSDYLLSPAHISLSPTMTLMTASTSIMASTAVASSSMAATTLSVAENGAHDGTINDANFAELRQQQERQLMHMDGQNKQS
jgi:hypothetical protein